MCNNMEQPNKMWNSLLNQTCRKILYPFAALYAQITLMVVFLWMLSDIRCFYCITMAMITRRGSLGGQEYCSCCGCDTKQIRHRPGGGIGRPEVHLAVNVGHWVRRRDILRELSSPCKEVVLAAGDYYRRRDRLCSSALTC